MTNNEVSTRKEYIEREAICYQLEKRESIDGQPRAIRRARRIVADFPAADVAPVRHAERDCLADGGRGMSILIKGMEMPKSCGECKAFVCYKQWAGDMGDCFCGITKNDAKAKAKNADCPLFPVPPHGDLIDRKALLADTTDMIHSMMVFGGARVYTSDAIKNAPTIIPASEEEET